VAEVVVVGGGVGGLAAAIRLRAAGHAVTVCERRPRFGGKLATRTHEGFHFDIGPSLFTLPHVFDALFRVAGTSLADEVDLVPLDPQFRYHFADGSTLAVPAGLDASTAAVEAFSPGSGVEWRAFHERARAIWEISERTFFAGPMQSPVALARRMDRPRDLVAIDAFTTLAERAARTFDDPRLRQWLGRYATYSGSSPYLAPATLACIPHIEAAYGCWHPRGGLGTVADALVRVSQRIGVQLRPATEIAHVCVKGRGRGTRIDGVECVDGSVIDADIVVANVDAAHLYRELLPDTAADRALRKAPRSGSGFVLCLAVEGHTPGVDHHTIWFPADTEREFRQLFVDHRPADDPTIYACVSARTDPGQAPEGCENWFVLVNAPPLDGRTDWHRTAPAYGELLLDRLAARGVELRDRIRWRSDLTPLDIEREYRAVGGSIYGTASHGRRAAFLRPGNRGPVRGLYLAGGSSHPGGGLPLVTMSAQIVADLVAGDRW
jgi:phytoene desaturase